MQSSNWPSQIGDLRKISLRKAGPYEIRGERQMTSFLLLITATALYAGYNLFIKVSGSHVPADATTIVLGTICLQLAALTTSIAFASILLVRGGHVFQLSFGSYVWAVAAVLPDRLNIPIPPT